MFYETVESFKIAENDFSACEGLNAMIQVKINKERLSFRLANAVTFKVYPLTIAAAIAESIVVPQETLRMDDDSPVQASKIMILLLGIVNHGQAYELLSENFSL